MKNRNQKSSLVYITVIVVVTLVSTARGQLDGEYHRCSGRDGDNVEVPVPVPDHLESCIVCTCIGGRVTCQNKWRSCPSVRGCSQVTRVPGQCCDTCAGCSVNGTYVASGDRVLSNPDKPCEVSTCFDGVVTVAEQKCDTAPGCDKPILIPGQCCPVCPQQKCEVGGHLLGDGETRTDPASPCRECTCKGGFLSCNKKTCPILSCPEYLQKTNEGDCCPTCVRRTQIMPDNRRCLWRNRFYEVGSKLLSDTCTMCTCSNGPTPTCKITCQAGERQQCSHNGQKYNHGDTWSKDTCTTCTCKLGQTECSPNTCPQCPPGTSPVLQPGDCCPACIRTIQPPQPLFSPPQSDGVCTVFGDPHYKTFDGKIYNFQGSCKYLLTRDCSSTGASGSGSSTNSSFSIRITNDARDTVAFSWLRTVTVRLGSTKVSLLQKMRVKVDGKKVTLPYIKLGVLSVMRDGYRVILRTNEGARLLWDGVSFLELTVPAKMRGNMCGLCGNFNGDKRDDFIGRHGNLLGSGQEFGNSWRVGGRKACSVLPRDVPARPPTCKHDWEGSIKSDKHCSAIKSTLFAACHAKVPPQFYFKACKIDMCECPGTQCHCEVLTAYARECERAGIRVSTWREQTGCRNVKPFKYSGEHASGETSATSDVNATLNEVITDLDGLEEFDDYDAPLDVNNIYMSLPAFRYNSEMAPLTATPSTTTTTTINVMEKHRKSEAEKRKEKHFKSQRRRERRRKLKNKSHKDKTNVRKPKHQFNRDSLGSYKGFTVEKVSNGGSRKRLKWGGKKKGNLKPPPFDMLLSSVDESDYVPHTSGEERTTYSDDYNDEYNQYDNDDFVVDNSHLDLSFSSLPSSRGRSHPPPLHESGERSGIYPNPSRRNYKRRRQVF